MTFHLETKEAGDAATSGWAPAGEIGGRYCENCHLGQVVPERMTINAISEGVNK